MDRSSANVERRLAAIMFTDIVGYTALMAESEEKGLRVRERHRTLVRPLVEQYHGESIEARGDESLSVFPTALDAVNCALAIEEHLQSDPELRLHVGIHLGDLVVQGGEVSGDGVNIASRICALSEGGGLCVSGEVYRSIRNQPGIEARALGEQELKNVPEPVAVYAVGGEAAPPRTVSEAGPEVGRRGVPRGLWAGALVVLTLGTGWWLYPRPAPDVAPLTAIAVLPFDDMSPGGDQEWLADGMAEELIEMLSRIEQLQVIARTSTFAFKGKDTDIREIGRQLNVGSVVEGSVRRLGDQFRTTAQLIRVSDGFHLWSGSYDRGVEDLFAVQREVASEVAEALRAELEVPDPFSWIRESRYIPQDVRAYENMQRGVTVTQAYTEEGLREAIEFHLKALEIDPGYAQAYAQLGMAQWILWSSGYDRSDENLSQVQSSAQRALAIDPANGVALTLLVGLQLVEREWTEAERLLRKAIDLNPRHANVRVWYGSYLLLMGQVEAAAREYRIATRIDPLWAGSHFQLGIAELWGGNLDAAISSLRRALEINPNLSYGTVALAQAYHQKGLDAEALDAFCLGVPTELEAVVRRRYEEEGWIGVQRVAAESMVAESGQACGRMASITAFLYADVGDVDRMYECLEESIEAKEGVWGLKANPVFAPYRSDLRFIALLRRMGLEE
jgi:TolB-like protein/class 3 adenylate cyclase